MIKNIKEIFSYKDTLINLIKKGIKTRYSNAILGYVWTVLTPVAFAIIIDFVFSNIINVGIENFALFVLSGLFAWNFFASSTTESSLSIIQSSDVAQKFRFPIAIIPISTVFVNLFIFLISLTVILPFFLIKSGGVLGALVFLPIITILLAFFVIGIALLLSSTNVYIRDVHHLFSTLILLWFWVTPIFYSMEMVPEGYRWICLFNPMTVFVNIYRQVLFSAVLPGVFDILIACAISLFSLAVGLFVFKKLEPNLAKNL